VGHKNMAFFIDGHCYVANVHCLDLFNNPSTACVGGIIDPKVILISSKYYVYCAEWINSNGLTQSF